MQGQMRQCRSVKSGLPATTHQIVVLTVESPEVEDLEEQAEEEEDSLDDQEEEDSKSELGNSVDD